MMTAFAIAPALAAVLNLFLIYAVYSSPQRNPIRRPFLLWNLWMSFWNLSIAVGYTLSDPVKAFHWYQWTIPVSIAFIAPFFLHFVLALSDIRMRHSRWALSAAYLSGGVFTFMGTGTTLLIQPFESIGSFWGNYPIAGPYAWTYGLAYLAVTAYAFWILGSSLAHSSGERKVQLRYLFYGAAICFGSGLTNFLPLYGIRIYPVGNLMNSVYSLVVAYAMIEHEFMNVRVVLRQGAVYGLLSGGMTAVYLSIVAVLQKLFGHYGIQEHFAFYMASFPVTVVLAPAMKTRIEPFVDQTLFGKIPPQAPSSPHNIRQETALMGILATEIAHELAKPLTHIMNERSRLENTLKSPNESLVKIEKEAQRAVEILDGFALLSPDRPLQRIPYSLADLLEEAITTLGLNEDGRVKIVRRLESLAAIWVNPGQMVQVFTNVIQNAWQAMRDRGTLTLSLSRLESAGLGGSVEIAIEDTGPGIPADIQEKIFEPFFTTKIAQGGRGVGLTISRAMVERHGGYIRVESPAHRHRGTRILIHLPIMTKEENVHGA